MAVYDRLGPLLLTEVLAQGPGLAIHRAISTLGGRFERHHLVATFSDELLGAGLAGSWPEAQRIADLLAGERSFGGNTKFETGPPAFMSCEYLAGRSLAQVLAKVRTEQVPLGVDHALTVLQSLAQAVLQLHGKNLHHGVLSPHSVWVSYEGAVQLLDAPVAALLGTLLPKAPALRAALESYAPVAPAEPLQRDLFALGAILFELLTLAKLPAGPAIPGALAKATLKAAQEDGAIPVEILGFLKRLLAVDEPFGSFETFSAELEQVLYEGDYSPTTFNMAFLMHTLFREENETDLLAMKTDQSANLFPYLPATPMPEDPAKGPGRNVIYLAAGGLVVAVGLFAGMFTYVHRTNQEHLLEQQSLQAKLGAFQREKEANDAKLAEIAKQEKAQKTLEAMFGQQAEQGATPELRIQAKKQLDASRLKDRKLAEQRAEAMFYNQQILARQNGKP